MEHFLINSSACLFALWLFYKLALENTSWHHWKRYYLLVAIAVSIIIPFIVVETIVIPIENTPMVAFTNSGVDASVSSPIQTEAPTFQINWTYVLQFIYVVNVLIMLWRFVKNLRTFRIHEEDHVQTYSNYQLILRNAFTVPHSFLQRIFVALKEFENNQIPKAVLEHEKAHLDQKHSYDILCIEVLLILFWFNPLLYIIRYSIKLNHEFLADRAVIEQGVDTVQYQETLLQYTQQSHSTALANTFNFPIIKKRFRIMKTQTSNTSLLLRSLALIPVLALLVMSCGKKETEFIDGNPGDSNIPQQLVELVDSKITKNKTFLVDGEEFTAQQTIAKLEKFPNASIDYGLKYDEKAILNIYTNKTTSDEDLLNILNYAIEHTSGKKFSESAIPKYNKLAIKHKEYMDKNNSLIVWKDETEEMRNIFLSMTEEQRANNEPWPYLERVENCKPGEIPPPPPPVIESISISEKEIEEYNWLLDRHKEFLKDEKRIVIFKEDTNRMVYLYSQMSAEHQSKNKAWHYLYKYNAHKAAEILPPPPPPLKAEGYIKVDDRFYYYTTKAGDKNLYDRNGKVIDIKGKKVTQVEQSDLPPPPPPAKLKSGTSINFQHNEPNQSDKDEKGYLRKGIAYRVNEQNELSSTFEANMDDNQKKELDYRLNIMRASQRAEDKINYIVEGKSAQLDDAYTFVYQNPLSHVEVYENANEILTLDFAKSDNPMSTSELQLVYMKVFEKYKPNSSLFND